MNLWQYETALYGSGWTVLCGVDEAGRGPLAGPVFAAAVILPRHLVIEGLNDSKKLSEKKREVLYDMIVRKAVSFGIGSADEKEIEALNISNATFLAMNRAIGQLDPVPELALVDGNRAVGIAVPVQCIVKGDGKSANIAAASILAKVSRDRYMIRLAEQYPQYLFEKHKGYPTKEHRKLLMQHGPSDVHRQKFIEKILAGEMQ